MRTVPPGAGADCPPGRRALRPLRPRRAGRVSPGLGGSSSCREGVQGGPRPAAPASTWDGRRWKRLHSTRGRRDPGTGRGARAARGCGPGGAVGRAVSPRGRDPGVTGAGLPRGDGQRLRGWRRGGQGLQRLGGSNACILGKWGCSCSSAPCLCS